MTAVDDMLARHQRVREFVQEKYPDCYVTEIVEHAKSIYRKRPKTHADFILAEASTEFAVETQRVDGLGPSITCDVALLDDGSLRLIDHQVFFVEGR